MAHLNWHGVIVRRWKHVTSDVRYHLTETDWLIRTIGPRMGRAKVIARPKQEDIRAKYVSVILADPSRYIEEKVQEVSL